MTRPKPLENPDFTSLISICEKTLDSMENGVEDDDDAHYIYEEAMTCVYGENIFDYINNLHK